MRSLSLFSLLFLTAASGALAAPKPLSMAEWHVAPRLNRDGTPAGFCAMAARYDGAPLVVTFTRNAAQSGTLALDFRNAALEPGKRYGVTTRVGDTSQTHAASAIGRTQLVVNTGRDDTLHKALAEGQTLTVSLDGTAGIYRLAGNKRAFFEFEHCVKALAPPTISANAPVLAAVPVERVVAENVPPPAPKEKPTFSLVKTAQADTPPTPKSDPTPAIVFDPAPARIAEPIAPPVTKPKAAEAPMKLALPQIEPAAAPEILWDAPPPAPKAAPVFVPAPEKIVAKAAEKPAPQESDDAAERLKSSLAKARETAAQQPAPDLQPAPLPAPMPTPKLSAVIWDDPVVAQPETAAPVLPVTLEKTAPQKKYVPLPPADVEITPLRPKKPSETGRTVPLKPQGFGAPTLPINDGIIRELPPALPPAIRPPLSVSAEPPALPRHYNTVIPSVGQPAQRSPSTSKPPRKRADFRPAPSAGKGSWGTRVVEPENGDTSRRFCLMEKNFENDSLLMIGQRGDGHSTLGIHYGIDMLQTDRDYKVTVQVDGEFEESFMAYAENPRVLVVQLGKKRSFFETLDGAEALRVAMPGTASSFKLDTLAQGLQEFSDCVVALGGEKIASPKIAVTIEEAPAAPIEKVTESALVAPRKVENIPPQPLETIRADETPPAAPPISWADDTRAFLFGLGLSERPLRASHDEVAWDLGTVTGHARRMKQSDLLDAATAALDEAERTCRGAFSSQIGLPENIRDTQILQMESKCATDTAVTVATWLIERRENGAITAWRFTSPREQRSEAFRQRALVQKALAEGGSVAYTPDSLGNRS